MFPNLTYNNDKQLDISGSVNISNEVSLNSSGSNQLNISNNGIEYNLGGVSGLITNIDKQVISNFDNPTTDIRVYRQSSIPTSEAVSNLIRKYSYISPFNVQITPGNPATYSIELKSQGISGMSFDINFSYDVNSDGDVVPSITAGPNLNNVVADPALKSCLTASRETIINDFVEYVQGARFSYIDSTTNQRVWNPNRFKRYIDPDNPDSETLYIGDAKNNCKSFEQLFSSTEPYEFIPANISDSSKPEYFLIQNVVPDNESSSSGKYISLNFLYEDIDLGGTINSSISGFTYNDSSILSYFNTFSWPFDISFTNTVFGPNLSSLFRNDYSSQNKTINPINPYAIRKISGLQFTEKITNFTGTLRNLMFQSISLSNSSLNLNNCTSIASVGSGCKACKLEDFIDAFQIDSWVIKVKTVDLHNFLSNCGANDYFKLNSNTYDYLNLKLENLPIAGTEKELDFSKLNGNTIDGSTDVNPFTGYLYYSFAYLMHPGPLTVPKMSLNGNYTYGNFYGSLVTEITNLSDIDVENALDLSNTFAFCHNLKSIDISTWNLDNVLNLNNFIYRSPNLTSLKIKNKYIEFNADDSITIKNDHTSYKPVCYTYDINGSTISYSSGVSVLSGYLATNKTDLDRSIPVWTIQLASHVNKNSSP